MTTNELIQGFKQGNKSGNCVSVAVIKAAMQVFGVNGIFHKIVTEDDVTVVTLRDGRTVSLDESDIALARTKSNFIGAEGSQIYIAAVFAFAVMGKRALQVRNEGAITYDEALDSLCNGENFTKGPEFLGLDKYAQRIKKRDIWKYAGVVGASKDHCYLASFGVEDKYGVPTKITQLGLLFNPAHYQYFYRILPSLVFNS